MKQADKLNCFRTDLIKFYSFYFKYFETFFRMEAYLTKYNENNL
jgi:hypothetical protein